MISLTLKEFALAVGADPKWVQNAKPRLGCAIEYTSADAQWVRLTRTLNRDLRVPLRFASELARAALAHSVADGDTAVGRSRAPRAVVCIVAAKAEGVRLTVDLRRQRSTFATAVAGAIAFGEPRPAGRKRRPPTHYRAALGQAWRLNIPVGSLRARARRAAGARMDVATTVEPRAEDAVRIAIDPSHPLGATASGDSADAADDLETAMESESFGVTYVVPSIVPVLRPPRWCADLSAELALPHADARSTLLRRLVENRVRFVLVGDFAEALAGALDRPEAPRADAGARRPLLDLCYAPTGANIRRLANVVRMLGALPAHPAAGPSSRRPPGPPGPPVPPPSAERQAAPFAADSITLRSSAALALTTSFGTLYLRREVAGIGGFDDVRRRATRVRTFGLELAVLDLAALVQVRAAGGRRSDVARLPMLETLLALPELEDRHRELAAKRAGWIDN